MKTEKSNGTPELKKEIKELKQQLEFKNKLLFLLDEATPKDQVDRKKYMADCAFFYNVVFKKKLQHFIGMQLEELARIPHSPLGDDIIRSNVNCFRLIDEWFISRSNEHFGNLEEIRSSFQDDDKFIKDVKKKYK